MYIRTFVQAMNLPSHFTPSSFGIRSLLQSTNLQALADISLEECKVPQYILSVTSRIYITITVRLRPNTEYKLYLELTIAEELYPNLYILILVFIISEGDYCLHIV